MKTVFWCIEYNKIGGTKRFWWPNVSDIRDNAPQIFLTRQDARNFIANYLADVEKMHPVIRRVEVK